MTLLVRLIDPKRNVFLYHWEKLLPLKAGICFKIYSIRYSNFDHFIEMTLQKFVKVFM